MLTVGTSGLNPATVLGAIRDSGRELMSTVNNMLKLTRWAEETSGNLQPASLLSLNQIESEILYEVHQSIPEQELMEISVMFENRLDSDDSMIVMDLSLLKECIQALIQNALSYTTSGAVIVVIQASPDYTRLTFDITDTGIGIPVQAQERIFEAYEKVDIHTRGAGLGLTLCAKIANALNGSVTLVASEQNSRTHGSTFRAEFLNPGFACPIKRPIPFTAALKDVPRSFHVVPAKSQRPELVLHFASYLEHRGFKDAETPENSMIILTYTPDVDAFRRYVASIDPRQVAVCLIPAGATIDKLHGAHEVRFFSGPFLTSRLEEITTELDTVYKRLHSNPEAGETISGLADAKNDAHRSNPDNDANNMDPADGQPVALLVDDNAINLKIMRMYCDKRKIDYHTASDGTEAVTAFEQSLESKPINLILMDLQMPVCDGIEATRKIRQIEREKALARSALFIVTGQDSVADKRNSYDAGADEYYVKPMGLQTLDRGIKEYFPAVAAAAAGANKEKVGKDVVKRSVVVVGVERDAVTTIAGAVKEEEEDKN
jgi:CheY-like chemotaxis protein